MSLIEEPVDANPIAAEHYGAHTVAVEPGGVEVVPDSERHGRPLNLLWTWTSPNLEFATVGVGIIAPLFFGLSFWQTVAAIVLYTIVSSRGAFWISSWAERFWARLGIYGVGAAASSIGRIGISSTFAVWSRHAHAFSS